MSTCSLFTAGPLSLCDSPALYLCTLKSFYSQSPRFFYPFPIDTSIFVFLLNFYPHLAGFSISFFCFLFIPHHLFISLLLLSLIIAYDKWLFCDLSPPPSWCVCAKLCYVPLLYVVVCFSKADKYTDVYVYTQISMSVSGHVCLSEATLASSTCMTLDYLNRRQHWLEATIKYPP